ncbi:MAG TPA: Ig-like domain-containing protein [Verrucomicrobiales bacterium]|nr:Ig-like domain-containing protein [Verrucomicrobiales bacterium]
MNSRLLRTLAFLLPSLAIPVTAQVSFTGSGYTQNFNSMGTGGTAAPAGWSFLGSLGGSNSTWTDSTAGGILATGTGAMSGGTANATLIAATTFTASSNTQGFNFALPASTSDRALGTSPTSGSGVVLQLSLTNNTGGALNGVQVGYLIRRFTAPGANELPGYWLFYSVANGTWINASALNPTAAGPAGVIVPNSTGVTTVPLTTVNFSTAWASGANLRLRWVDDNAVATSPDQIYGLDDVTILPAQPPPVVTLTAPAPGASFAIPVSVPLAADAMDNGTVTKVEFFAGAVKVGEDQNAPFTFDWTPVLSGTYALTAVATDDSGASTTSAPVSITVTNPANIAPAVAIISPPGGTTVPASSLTVFAAATDTDGLITKVEFYSNGVKAGEAVSAPYSFVIPNIEPGPLTLTVAATDNDGVVTTSAPVQVNAVAFTDTVVLPRGAVWKYYDQGTDQGTEWRNADYVEAPSPWASGPAELGYGDSPVTAIRQGPDGMTSTVKYITYYFRSTFTIADVSKVLGLAATLERDDGAVIYINGVEVARSNMPAGAINYLTTAVNNTGDTPADETTYFPLTLPANVLVNGPNVIAVEVHQSGTSSSDISFDMDLTVTTIGGNALPSVSIASPVSGASFNSLATIPITANASDSDGSIVKVEFYNGASKLGESTTAPYGFIWSGVAAGSYVLTAVTTDDAGGRRTSVPVSVSVVPGPSGSLTRGPYLQRTSPVQTTIRWRSSASIAGRVRYGTRPDALTQVVNESAATTEHIVPVTGLSACTT